MASPEIIILTQENFRKEVLESAVPVVVDFGAEWCGPCKQLVPILDTLADEYKGRVKIGKVDVDEQRELAAQYSVNAVPMVLYFKKGEVADQMIGMRRTLKDLRASFDKLAA